MGSRPEVSDAAFKRVFIHEFGHYLNLDHSQVGLAEATDGDPADDEGIAIMFPFAVDGDAAATLHLDDRVAISTLYPAPGFTTGFGRITGHVYFPDTTTRWCPPSRRLRPATTPSNSRATTPATATAAA